MDMAFHENDCPLSDDEMADLLEGLLEQHTALEFDFNIHQNEHDWCDECAELCSQLSFIDEQIKNFRR
jgi:hypothetical protein